MNSHSTDDRTKNSADEAAVRALPQGMIEAWNRGSAEDFAAPFMERADFVAFEGTHLEGRPRIAQFHREVFDNAVKGTRLRGEVKFVHFSSPRLAVMHAVGSMALPGHEEALSSRDSMQLFVAVRQEDAWRLQAVLNARKLTLERQRLWDDFESLSAAEQGQVVEFIVALRRHDRTAKEKSR